MSGRFTDHIKESLGNFFVHADGDNESDRQIQDTILQISVRTIGEKNNGSCEIAFQFAMLAGSGGFGIMALFHPERIKVSAERRTELIMLMKEDNAPKTGQSC